MATTYVFDRGSQYGDAEFLGSIDLGCDGLTQDQMDAVREAYVRNVQTLINAYDSTLEWYPYLSEVWGEVGNTESDPTEFRDWWNQGNEDGRWETAFLNAYNETIGE